MASATDFIDNTSADVFIPEMWSSYAVVATENATVLANFVCRKYESDLTKGDKINLGNISNLTIQTKSENTAIDYQTVTETNQTITVSTHKYVAIAIESITKAQADRDMIQAYTGKMGYALALDVDDALAALIDALDNSVGALAIENTDTELRRAIQYLDDADAPDVDRVWVFSPAASNGISGMDKYISNDYSAIHGPGPRSTQHERAYITNLYTYPAYKTVNVDGTNAAGHDNVLLQKEALALVMQIKPRMWGQQDIDYFADKVALEQLYGVKEIRGDHGVCIFGA